MGSVWTCCMDIWSSRGVQGLQRSPEFKKCYISSFAQFLSHCVTLSCAGLSIQITGIQGTAWDLFEIMGSV